MPKYTRAQLQLFATTILLTLAGCRGSDSYTEPVGPSGPSNGSLPLTLSPSSFHLREGDSVPVQVKTGNLGVPTTQVHWAVVPASAAKIVNGRTLVALSPAKGVRVTATVGASTASATGTITPLPVELQHVGPLVSTGVAGRPLSDSLAVGVLGASGEPVEGETVSFEILTGAGRLSHTSRVSGSDGVARAAWTLGPKPGDQSVRATVAGLQAVTVSVEVLPDFATATAQAIQGVDQTATAGALLPTPLTVEVADSLGNILPGVQVTWSFSSGTGFETGGSSAQARTGGLPYAGRSAPRWESTKPPCSWRTPRVPPPAPVRSCRT